MEETKAKVIERAMINMTEEKDKLELDCEMETTPWSDPPIDVMEMILSRLYLMDCSRFHAVSRIWQSIPTPVRLAPSPNPSALSPAAHTPWLISFKGRYNTNCNFFHPIYDDSYSMDIPELSGSTIRASKDGWLLMCKATCFYFFFNPFTKARVDVPKLHRRIASRISFSAPPTSSECLIFGIFNKVATSASAMVTYTIRWGEENWKISKHDNNLPFFQSESNPVFLNGVFYCLGEEGNLGVFDPKMKEGRGSWTILAKPQGPQPPPSVSIYQYFLVECGGDLLSVFLDRMGSWICLLKLEVDSNNEMVWKKLGCLGDRMLFLSIWSCISAKEVVKGMGNKIYFNRFGKRNDSVFYSLETEKYHCLRVDLYTEKERSSLSRTDLYNTKERLDCAWVEYKFETPYEEELNWVSQ